MSNEESLGFGELMKKKMISNRALLLLLIIVWLAGYFATYMVV